MFVFQRSGAGEALDAVVGAPHPVWSIRTWSLLTSSATSALPTCGPPTRKYTSDSVVGLAGSIFFGPAAGLADPQQHRRLDGAGVDRDAGDDDAGHVGDRQRHRAVDRGERRVPQAEHDRVGALDVDAAVDVVDAGREQQVLAAREPAVDRCAESAGVATKKSSSGIVRPGVSPASQVMPRVSVCAAGTRTWYRPSASTKRYGFSRLTGVVSRVVYGGFGNVASDGAPSTPAKTWFQTAFDQPPIRCCGSATAAASR